MDLSDALRRQLVALEERGCTVREPEHDPADPTGRVWLCVVLLPDGEEMKGRGPSPQEAAAAAISRALGSPQLGLLDPE